MKHKSHFHSILQWSTLISLFANLVSSEKPHIIFILADDAVCDFFLFNPISHVTHNVIYILGLV